MPAEAEQSGDATAATAGAVQGSALEALIAALGDDDPKLGHSYKSELTDDAAAAWRAAETSLLERATQENAPSADAATSEDMAARPSTPPLSAPTPDMLRLKAEQPRVERDQPIETAPFSPSRTLRAPTLDAPAIDMQGMFDFNSYYDEVGLAFEAAARPAPTPFDAEELEGLDPGRAALIRAEAREAGCPPAAILAAAVDLYFSVLDNA
ncbi:MAG: hypothetical protein MRY74_16195 [Neomegalonema sp.]|nr:hypothetical protein [Neomegalonema sp.]